MFGPIEGGIWGRQSEGACAIILNGGYEDDRDKLDEIFYTGEGGRDPQSLKQISDQEFVKGNRALQLSHEYNLPVRVIRGFKAEKGPSIGYRYDGIYFIDKVDYVKGKSGFMVCEFHLVSENSYQGLTDDLSETFKPDYKPAPRKDTKSKRIVRNASIAEAVKDKYDNTCQVCNQRLDSPSGPISVAAHIRGLGNDGPDTKDNLLCLCPNHHAQFDSYSFYIEPQSFEIIGLKDFEGEKITLKHKVNSDFLEYQKKLFLKHQK